MNQANIGGRYLNNGAWTDSGENAQKDENNEDIRRYRKIKRGERQIASDWEDGWLDILD